MGSIKDCMINWVIARWLEKKKIAQLYKGNASKSECKFNIVEDWMLSVQVVQCMVILWLVLRKDNRTIFRWEKWMIYGWKSECRWNIYTMSGFGESFRWELKGMMHLWASRLLRIKYVCMQIMLCVIHGRLLNATELL